MEQLESTSYVSGARYTECWLRQFLSNMEANKEFLNVSIDTEEGFMSALKEVSYSTQRQASCFYFHIWT